VQTVPGFLACCMIVSQLCAAVIKDHCHTGMGLGGELRVGTSKTDALSSSSGWRRLRMCLVASLFSLVSAPLGLLLLLKQFHLFGFPPIC
jgi:hypothetical protein